MTTDNMDLLRHVTRELYPGIAKRYQTTSRQVEQAIRHAKNVAWDHGGADTIKRLFGDSDNRYTDKPTNRALIALVADQLRFERMYRQSYTL
ncbi:MAG: sporulation initiation factor Spo0A C-terminal domain-containing protein [Firmicutes bacterium]|nr:sporulation initiation factor Spo0A C-terminal domain-containing protein [Bacillota bacterium]